MNTRPKIIELVGLGGAGKSSLARALQHRNREIQIFPLPRSRFYTSLVKQSSVWLPLWYRGRRGEGYFSREELLSVGCIDAWFTHLQQKTSTGRAIAMLDPGSIYWLTKLQQSGAGLPESSRYGRWLQEQFDRWSSALDLIVWLDAPEELCLERILGREEWHHAKFMEREDILERFRGLRTSYERIIKGMTSRRPVQVYYFRTDEVSTEAIIERISSEVDLTPLPRSEALAHRPHS